MSAEGPERQPDKASQVGMPGVPDARPAAPEPAADAAAPKPEAAPVTVEAPDAQKPKPEAAPRPPVIKTKEDMARAQMRTRVDELDRDILDFQEQIDKEEDTGKQAKMRDKLAEKVSKREEAYAEYKEAIKELDAKITKIKQELAKIDALKKDIGTLKAFIAANKNDLDKTKITELAGKTRALDDKESELKKLAPKDREADLRATLAVYTAERLRITEDAERRDEIGEADRTLAREMAIALGETPPDEPAKSDEAAVKGEAPLTAEQKELILDNKIDQIALDLARLLASDVPKDTDTFGQYSFQAKRALLIVLSYCGGDPAWANNLNKDEQKALGMTVSSKADSDGKTLTTIKWDKIDFSLNKVQNVYEVAFGKEGWAKEMGELTPTTKLKDLQDKVAAFPVDTTDPKQQQMIKFVDALVKSGATPESGVQEFVIKNSKQIIAIYKPETATPAAGTEATESGEKLVDPVEIIKAKGLKNDTPLGELLKAIDPAYSIPPDLTIETAPLKAAEIMETLTSAEAIAAYQAKIEMNSHSLVLLGLPDTTEALQPIFTTASREMQSNNQLSADTKKALETGIKEQMIATKALADKPCKEILENMKGSIDEPNGIKQIEAILAALEENSKAPAVPDAPAPEASTK